MFYKVCCRHAVATQIRLAQQFSCYIFDFYITFFTIYCGRASCTRANKVESKINHLIGTDSEIGAAAWRLAHYKINCLVLQKRIKKYTDLHVSLKSVNKIKREIIFLNNLISE